MPIGEIFLSAILQVLFEKLASGLILAFAKRERIYKLLERWSKRLSIIQAMIDDAEEKQLTDKPVKLWLEGLRDLAYDLDDVMDEIATEASIQESELGVNLTPGNKCRFIPSCVDLTPGAFMFKKKMSSKIEKITARLESIEKEGIFLNLSRNSGRVSNQSIYRDPSTSVTEPHVYGREKDKIAVSQLMVHDQEKVSVIPIVGMGGIGKTTLAQLIYNDEVMAGAFDLKAWVCVSEDFDVFTITKTIFQSVTRTSAESKDLNTLQESLHETFSKNKFLLILDDVWNESYAKWNLLCRPFLGGLAGSKVFVTTRHVKIATMVGSIPSYYVNLLTYSDCLSLLAQHALGKKDFNENLEFKGIGESLVKKCKGLPLAAKTLGGLLRSKQTPAEWEDVLHSKIWDLPKENDILPVLRLSYHHLPSHLKGLFAYCSIFPKDYEFERHELVLLWMGEGFLSQPDERKTKEELGFEYFNELLSRSFFQQLSSDDSHFLMHDLINDLAQFVAGGICYKLDEKVENNDEYKIHERSRHASFLRHEYEVFRKFRGFYRAKGLRTFLPMPVQNSNVWPPFYLSNRILFELLPGLHSMRVMSLSGYSITELPGSICSLIHLRYLNLSGTSIASLPDSVSDLYNLEILSISNCRFISKLPPTIGNLVNLRHLDNSNTDQLRGLPVEMGKLENLQTLPKIVLGSAGELGLKELRNLPLLRGKVVISELRNFTNIEDAKEAGLGRKHGIEELHLTWGNDIDEARDKRRDEGILDALRPHESLRKLAIEFYGGVKFPKWVGDPSFNKLVSVSIEGCCECTSLPPLGLMPELKHLVIKDMPKIKSIGAEFFKNGALNSASDVPFSKLETLIFNNLPAWENWSCINESQVHFPVLSHLTIFQCPKLNSVSPMSFPVLNQLDLQQCSVIVLESFHNLELLSYLKVESVTGLAHLPVELVQSMSALEVLECCNCNELLFLWPNEVTLQHITRLKRLIIADCLVLTSMGEQELISNLEILEIFRCANLTSLPNGLKNHGSLRDLIIQNCPKLVDFPENITPPMLKRLEILNCKALVSLPSGISNLERLEIKECSSLTNWSEGIFVNLKKLSIKNSSKLKPVFESMFPSNGRNSMEEISIWGWPNSGTLLQKVHNFSRLSELTISYCDVLEYFPEQGLPPGLKKLCVDHCSNFRSLPSQLQSMLPLASLEIRTCRKLKSFPRCDFPPNLSSLSILDSRKLKPLSRWGLHRLASLREFSICGGFQELQLLSDNENLFPCSLIKLSIARFAKLGSLSKVLENLNSLQHLSIMNCTSLDELPSGNLLEKLWHLEISDCPILKQRCLKEKGDYWPKIEGIPCVKMDESYISRQSSE